MLTCIIGWVFIVDFTDHLVTSILRCFCSRFAQGCRLRINANFVWQKQLVSSPECLRLIFEYKSQVLSKQVNLCSRDFSRCPVWDSNTWHLFHHWEPHERYALSHSRSRTDTEVACCFLTATDLQVRVSTAVSLVTCWHSTANGLLVSLILNPFPPTSEFPLVNPFLPHSIFNPFNHFQPLVFNHSDIYTLGSTSCNPLPPCNIDI